ncbi:MAG: 30S ribosomal protein S16 [Patescibacteria group bacterium]
MLKIRLQRVGRKNDPSFRVVLIESFRAPKSGAVQEILGNYDARQKRIVLKRDRIDYWHSKGAQITQTVSSLMKRAAK